MAYPPQFTPSEDYSDFETAHPNSPKPGASLDTDFNNISTSIEHLISFHETIQNVDGSLKPGIVGPDQLASDLTPEVAATMVMVTAAQAAQDAAEEAAGQAAQSAFNALTSETNSANSLALAQAAAAAAQASAVVAQAARDVALAVANETYNVVANTISSATGDGTTDDTAAINALLANAPAGSVIYFPGQYTFKCTDQLAVAKKLYLTGPGLLNFTAGITNKSAIAITANGCQAVGLNLKNPNMLQSPTGGRNVGISVAANEFIAMGNVVELFQNGIAVSSGGEYENIIISNNRIKDCLGAGGGRGSGSSQGEDRGDGIVIWGTQATVTGNIVNCLAGQDGRIGIHGEALDGFAAAPPPTGYYHSMMNFVGNTVYGQFRRGLVFEGIDNGCITANSVADSTWWNIALAVGCKSCVVAGNSIIATRTALDDQGYSWSVNRAALAVYGKCYDCTFTGNRVRFAPGCAGVYGFNMQGTNSNKTITGITSANPGVVTSAAHGFSNGQRIMLLTSSSGVVELDQREYLVANVTTDTFELNDLANSPVDTTAMGVYTSGGTVVVNVPTRCVVESNSFQVDGSPMGDCFYCPYSYDTVFRDNLCIGPFNGRGIYAFNPIRMTLERNKFIDFTGRGIHVEGSSFVRCNDNVFRRIGATAVYVANGANHELCRNRIEGCTYGFDLSGTTSSMIDNNMVIGQTVGYVNNAGTVSGATANTFRNNNWQRLVATTFTWDVGNLVDGAREQYGSDITVTGAALGDVVTVTCNTDPQGVKFVGWVSSANTVRIAAENETGVAVNLPSTSFYVRVDKRL